MSLFEKIKTSWIQIFFYLRLAPNASGFLPSGKWNASRLLAERAKENPSGTALLFEDDRFSWSDFESETNRWANFFESCGVKKGDALALLMDNRPEYLFALLGLNRLGAVAALINTNIVGQGLVHAIEISNASGCIVGVEHEEKLHGVVAELQGIPRSMIFVHGQGAEASTFERAETRLSSHKTARSVSQELPKGDDPMCFIYTSGTTGLPKAAIIKNSRWLAAASMFGLGLLNLKPADISYVSLPLYHSNGMFAGLGASLTTGAALALRRKFSASNFWNDVRKFDATAFIYIGELLRYLLNQPPTAEDQAHKIRVITGNGLRPDIWETFVSRFNIQEIREFYGATEGNAPTVNLENRAGMIGRLRAGQSIVRCDLETGEIIRGEDGFVEKVEQGQTGLFVGQISKTAPFDGYADEAATDKKVLKDLMKTGDRFFNSGDLVTLHENAWLSFADRVGDTFRWKGENVSTNEVAETLNGARGVLEANVYGVMVPGADGRAGMASLNHDETFSLSDFTKFVIDNLPGYQRPYFLRLQQEMRITGTFKHQKVDYRKEGYDPKIISDPLYILDQDQDQYRPVDEALFDSIKSGEYQIR